MSGVRENSSEIQVLRIVNKTRNLDRFRRLRLNSDSMSSAVDLYKNIESNTSLFGFFVKKRQGCTIVGE